jgi:RimJ/RimL family protein N-acetyltransferase
VAEVVAETERLRLRTWDRDDRDEFIRHTNTESVMRWLGGVWPRERHDTAFDRLESYQREHGHTFWIVERKSDGALLGFCGLKRVNTEGAPFPGDVEVGWRLREDAWGQGYAKEAALASLDLAFDRFKAPHVVAITVKQNEASQGLMKRLNMVRRADLDFPSADVPPELNPVITYRMDADDWPAARAAAISPGDPGSP